MTSVINKNKNEIEVEESGKLAATQFRNESKMARLRSLPGSMHIHIS